MRDVARDALRAMTRRGLCVSLLLRGGNYLLYIKSRVSHIARHENELVRIMCLAAIRDV